MVKQIFKYWYRIENTNKPLLIEGLKEDKLISGNEGPWFHFIRKILKDLKMDHYIYQIRNLDNDKFVNQITKELKDRFKRNKLKELKETDKKYLEKVVNIKHRRSLSRFRMSAHNLEIENGRYRNIPKENRLCKICNTGDVEDEIHFTLHCPALIQIRDPF